jgi:hypothetical protein
VAKQTRIIIETHSLLIVQSRHSRRGWCRLCGAEEEMIVLANLDAIPNLERPVLEAWLNSADLHRSLADDGSNLICLNSLLARAKDKIRLTALAVRDT